MAVLLLQIERIDTWVFWVGISFPVVCILVLVLVHLLGWLFRKRQPLREPGRASPEPLRISREDPEQLERSCAALEETLARRYLDLAESRVRNDQAGQAVAVLQKLIQRCPQTREAKAARERLRELGAAEQEL